MLDMGASLTTMFARVVYKRPVHYCNHERSVTVFSDYCYFYLLDRSYSISQGLIPKSLYYCAKYT